MTTDTLVEDTAVPASRDNVGADERGRTHVEARVVERIAAAVVDESDQVLGGPRHLLGVRLGQQEGVRVQASLRDNRVEIRVAAVLAYPCSVRAVVGELRERVITRVKHLTGMHVLAVDFSVTGLAVGAPPKVR